MIKSIVLSGGNYLGLIELGLLQNLFEKKFLKMDEIEQLYGTSIGGFVCTLLCLNIPFDDLCEYFEKRPWHKILDLDQSVFTDFFFKKGIIKKDIFEKTFKNLLESVNLSLNITLKEFYHYSNKELHLFSIRISDFTLVDISYKTHPDLELIDAVFMTCSLPFIFQPISYENEYYIDGGLLCNCPLEYALKNSVPEEVLCIMFSYDNHEGPTNFFTNFEEKNVIEYNLYLYLTILQKMYKFVKAPDKVTQIIVETEPTNLEDAVDALFNSEERVKYINMGKEMANNFLLKKEKNNISK